MKIVIYRLAKILNKRFELSKEIAVYKAIKRLPILDYLREEEVLSNAHNIAKSNMLLVEYTDDLIKTQINISKSIQQRYLRTCNFQLEKTFIPSSLTKIREKIINLDREILSLISYQIIFGEKFIQQKNILFQLLNEKLINSQEKRTIIKKLEVF